jgi:4-hydroxyphenylpyruvate dioxygenase-like putative hemolysin
VNATTTETLTAADRCDRCGAQAYVRVVLATGELLFCAHHAREHAAALSGIALNVQDETQRLLGPHGTGSTL